jgi:hypothetical protein
MVIVDTDEILKFDSNHFNSAFFYVITLIS